MIRITKLISLLLAILYIQNTNAQYFGKNKVKYGNFDFKVVESNTFDTYHYLENDSLIIGLVKDAEKWRTRHEVVFKDSFDYKVPLLFYKNHGDFQQTSVVGGLIGTSTGGVTEGMKNRVTMPLTASYAQTDHVLGHELVHAHQYNMIKSGDSLSFQHMANIPLWMTEGLAEYMSIGSVDAHTAMWMRDAIVYDYFPRIKDLYKSRYFPYRYGQAFWAFVGGTFGDDKIYPLYRETAKFGVKEAFKKQLGMPIDSFSKRWKETTEKHYTALMKGRNKEPLGKKLVNEENGGRLNITPAVSPDGKYFIFLSERNIFSLDLFLADANTGKIIRKLSTKTRKSHIDALDAFESAGTWSPDSKKYAFVIYSKGKNKLVIADVSRGKVIDEFFIPNIPSFNNLDWSPIGNKILFTGLKKGQSDLFTFDIDHKTVVQLTDDYFAQLQPKWSPDGTQIVYVSDHLVVGNSRPSRNMSFEIIEVPSKKKIRPEIFTSSNNLNPSFSSDGKSIYFLSDREGFRDAYQYEIGAKKIYQLTQFSTGISGITKYSPAISFTRENNEMLYSLYSDSKYNIYKVDVSKLDRKEVASDDESKLAATLPSLKLKESFVNANLENDSIKANTERLKERDYEPKFKLDYISNGGVGISTGRYGTGMAGGINMLFGDMLNDNQVYVGAVLNGEIQDFGVQAAYLNRKNRYAWGGGASHIPYRYVTYNLEYEDIEINGNTISSIKQTYNVYRIFKEQASVFSYYPFSKATRIEGGTSFSYYSFRLDKYFNYYDQSGFYYLGQDKERNLDTRDPFALGDVSLAFVGDNSSFGLAAPMKGYRYRIEVQQSYGELAITSLLADVRKYFYLRPVTLAFRGYSYSRLGKNATDDLMPPLYLGYGTLVRGYNYKAFNRSNTLDDNSLIPNDLVGNRMLIANAELRLPFTGPERLAVIKSGFLFSDLNLFFDAGMIWGKYGRYDEKSFEDAVLVTSAGLSARINFFGQIILEPYFAFPLQLEGGNKGVFGLNFTPGW